MKLDIRSDVDDVLGRVEQTRQQLTSVVLVAINRTLADVKRAQEAELRRAFDRPTPYTLGSLGTRQATRQRLEGEVLVKDERASGKGIPATKYLLPNVEGGDRNLKRFERALRAAGILLPGWFAVPAAGARLDAYGNMERGQIVQILAYFNAFGEVGYRANLSDKGRARIARGNAAKGVRGLSYFALPRARGKLPPGIYSRLSGFGYIKPVLLFVDGAPNYERRWDWAGTAERTARRVFRGHLARAQQEANARRAARAAGTLR